MYNINRNLTLQIHKTTGVKQLENKTFLQTHTARDTQADKYTHKQIIQTIGKHNSFWKNVTE